MSEGRMQLQVLLPTEILVDEPATKVIAEAANGAFCLLPRHIDFVAALVPGILLYETTQGKERLLANDTGILVKAGDRVRVSVLNAVRGTSLDALRETVEAHFKSLDEHERLTRSALARLEAGTLRRFQRLEQTHESR
ncbi:F0F1 ATP synthase subunit epsilon [Thioalkalivibrio sp.]|uniref:F0F1 ATP synthase subunit epsilon n=1 Tax=Thioalkalivibrio sp. TaxID=2093813 RepID=UPI003975D519